MEANIINLGIRRKHLHVTYPNRFFNMLDCERKQLEIRLIFQSKILPHFPCADTEQLKDAITQWLVDSEFHHHTFNI